MYWMIRPILVLTVLICGTTEANPLAPAQWQLPDADTQLQGLALFEEYHRRESGYGDLEVRLRMVLRSAKGRATERELHIKQLEVENDGDRVLAVFDAPANIRGTALLSHAHLDRDDDQWLFLPALKRTKKIASRNKTGPFVGSEFSFEDLSPPEVEKYNYAYVGQEPCGELTCYIVDRFPKDQYSGYKKHRVWLDQQELRFQKVEYTNRRGVLEKRLMFKDYLRLADQFFKPNTMHMENLLTGRGTDLYWYEYVLENNLSADRDFSVNSLRRAR
jgi:hypothetical protein